MLVFTDDQILTTLPKLPRVTVAYPLNFWISETDTAQKKTDKEEMEFLGLPTPVPVANIHVSSTKKGIICLK